MKEVIGLKKTLKIYQNYKGLQVNFPTRLYDREYVVKRVLEAAANGEDTRKLALRYDYSERWIRKIIKDNKKEYRRRKENSVYL